MESFLIRPAVISEQKNLEDLQRRASPTDVRDRDASLAHTDATELPPEKVSAGAVFVLEQNGSRGFTPRPLILSAFLLQTPQVKRRGGRLIQATA